MKKEIVEKETAVHPLAEVRNAHAKAHPEDYKNDGCKKAEVDPLKGKFCFSTRCHGARPAKFLRSGLPFCSNACVRHSGLKNPKLDSDSKKLYTFTTMTQGSNYLVNRGKKVNTDVPVNSENPAFNPVAPGIKSPVQHGLICNTMQGFGRGRK